MNAPYSAPKQLSEVMRHLEFEEGLSADDPRYVDTLEARGSQKLFRTLARRFGWWDQTVAAPIQKHMLFFGHLGSGKTTELRHYTKRFNDSGLFCAIEVNVNAELDRNNLQFPDVLMAMARALLDQLQKEEIVIGDAQLRPLYDWFASTVQTRLSENALAAEIKTGANAGLSIPLLGKLFASVTASFRTGATYRKEIRDEIRNSYGRLAEAFNEFMKSSEQALNEKRGVERVLFILDGTDKLRDEDSQRLFVYDVAQMSLVNTLVIYAAPLHLAYENNVGGRLDHVVLPMIKISERDGHRCRAGRTALTAMLERRADPSLFADRQAVKTLIDTSGGHPRELLRLLKYCCEFADTTIDSNNVNQAINALAAEYRRFLEPEDYVLLVAKDADEQHGGNDERTKRLLYRLALLEYNEGSWQRSHPAVRTLDGYTRAKASNQASAAQGN